MTGYTSEERLVALETNLTNLKDIVLQTNTDTKNSFREISEKLDKFVASLPNYVTIEKHEETIRRLELEIESSKRKSSLQVWITSSLAAGFAVILTILIQNYFS